MDCSNIYFVREFEHSRKNIFKMRKIKTDVICKVCKVHTNQLVKYLEHNRYQLFCKECCTLSSVYDKDGREITHEEMQKEKDIWQ